MIEKDDFDIPLEGEEVDFRDLTLEQTSPDELLAKRARERQIAQNRLNDITNPRRKFGDDREACEFVLNSYGEPARDTAKLSPHQAFFLAMSYLTKDYLLVNMIDPDGRPSNLTVGYYPEADPEDYHYVGTEMPAAARVLARTLIKAGIGVGDLGSYWNHEDLAEIIHRYITKFSKKGKPAVIVIPGKINFSYGQVTIALSPDFVPPYGAGSENVTVYVPAEE